MLVERAVRSARSPQTKRDPCAIPTRTAAHFTHSKKDETSGDHESEEEQDAGYSAQSHDRLL